MDCTDKYQPFVMEYKDIIKLSAVFLQWIKQKKIMMTNEHLESLQDMVDQLPSAEKPSKKKKKKLSIIQTIKLFQRDLSV